MPSFIFLGRLEVGTNSRRTVSHLSYLIGRSSGVQYLLIEVHAATSRPIRIWWSQVGIGLDASKMSCVLRPAPITPILSEEGPGGQVAVHSCLMHLDISPEMSL